MFLKTLTLKGFKSFADRMALHFEPGVTVVVGPNGSGKSNVVDAVGWVLGAQGPSTMRSGKMDDVIFAGTPQRPALGRAEVSLTIDNSSGILPIDFTEVEITRTLFRSGDSEYAINGVSCRLLDIQELLSDTGIGRNQHVIVGQGQVDAVLNALPAARRAVVEEAAGILKYRRRKEKAQRRLEASETSMLRLQDTLREVKRQLRPLERQADAARRYDAVEAELRAIRIHLLGRQIGQYRKKVDESGRRGREDAERERTVRDRLAQLDATTVAVEDTLGGFGDDALDDAMVRAEGLAERSRGLAALVAEKRAGIERARRAVTEAALAEADEARRRHAGSEAHARAEELALALDEARAAAGAGVLSGLDGVMGLLGEHIEIAEGAERAVAAALGEAMRALVVRDAETARTAIEELSRGDACALLLVVEGAQSAIQGRLVPAGARPLAEMVTAKVPGLEAVLSALLDGVVFVESGWREALALALAHPALTVTTPAGERFRVGDVWRAGASFRDGASRQSPEALEHDLIDEERRLVRIERVLEAHLAAAAALHERFDAARRARGEARRGASKRLEAVRGERSGLERELEQVRERLQRLEIEDAEARMRLETAVETARRDFDCEPEVAVESPAPTPPQGSTLGERARELERELRLMGPVNPLALEEYEALQERHRFLEEQLEDIRESRRDLRKVIRAVDDEIAGVFAQAYADVERHFAELFNRLFPGGQGGLMLTDPDDMLETGIEIEARPSGKNVRRLSLLSGGERSLVALAFLFAVFRARPSPFYLLDEVEAALDDVNLHRFLELIHEFRDEAQLVIVSHQKRTMEAADVLYGISMPPGGSSKAVSERLETVLA